MLETEIREQSTVLARFLRQQRRFVSDLARHVRSQSPRYIVIAARGSSDNAARYAQYLFGAYNRLPVVLATPSLHTLYQSPPLMKDALVIGISQSGRSPDIISVIETARAQGCATLAITNDPQSTLAQTAEWVLPLEAGEERAVAATKTYTTSLAALALLSALIAEDRERLTQLEQLPELADETLRGLQGIAPAVERYTFVQRGSVIGRGFSYSTAFEVALKIKELTQVIAEPYSSADFLHGPISIVTPNFLLILIAPAGRALADIKSLAVTAAERGAEIIAISNDSELLQQSKTRLPIPRDVPEWLSPAITVLPGQLFALHLTLAKGLDADRPSGLHKITETC